jgi:hypothetical protein
VGLVCAAASVASSNAGTATELRTKEMIRQRLCILISPHWKKAFDPFRIDNGREEQLVNKSLVLIAGGGSS